MSTNLTIVVVVAVIIIFLIFYAATSTGRTDSRKEDVKSKAEKLRRLAGQPITDSEMRDIVVQFDSLLAKALQIKLHNNDTCGENLKRARPIFNKSSYEAIWKAHKLRNVIVHDGETPTDKEFDRAVKSFTSTISKLLG